MVVKSRSKIELWVVDITSAIDHFIGNYRQRFASDKDDFTAVSSALRQYLPEKDTPYILDVDLDFFSTKNPFKDLHERVNLYDKLAPLFTYKRTESNDPEVSLS
ncbi:CE022 protein, partial [Acromyrmex heyeri]